MSRPNVGIAILVGSALLIGGYMAVSLFNASTRFLGIVNGPVQGTSYQEMTRETLASLPDEELEKAIVDFVAYAKIKNDYENEYGIVRSLPAGFQHVYATWLLEAEVYNGGFNQYFYNASGQFQQEALEGLERMGAQEHADLLSEAITIYEDEKAMHEEVKRRGTIEAFSESYSKTGLNRLDEEFYSVDEDMSKLRIAYIRKNIEEFISD